MKKESPRIVAARISATSPQEAAAVLKGLLSKHGDLYVWSVLDALQDCDRDRHGQDDEWWLHMMHEAGDEISRLF